jgi:hypothetical protein
MRDRSRCSLGTTILVRSSFFAESPQHCDGARTTKSSAERAPKTSGSLLFRLKPTCIYFTAVVNPTRVKKSEYC